MVKAKRTKVRYVDINVNRAGFVSKFIGSKKEQDFSDIKLLRSLLSDEKARILYFLSTQEPFSIYDLAKKLKRDLKSVRKDLQVLERFGFIDFYSEKKGKRKRLKPVLVTDRLEIIIDI
jgi:predicted transcriptional regulator